jgi:hypothetical protein
MFALAGAVVWALLGAALAAALPGTGSYVAGILAVLTFGGAQLFSRGPARVPQRAWQVPRPWIDQRGPWGRLAVWAATLGPGLMTRNPYVSYWAIVPALGALPDVGAAVAVGAAAGAAHGLGRFGGIVLRQRDRPGTDWNLLAVLWHIRLVRVDGLLLVATGTAALIGIVVAGS